MKPINLRGRVFKAFTLLELIIVMAIMSILGAIIVPNTLDRIRQSKIESANALSYELYTATQNFLTDQQIKNKSLVFDTGKEGVFPVKNDLKGSHKDKIIFGMKIGAVSSEYWAPNNKFSRDDGLSASEVPAIGQKVVNGILRYLGETNNAKTDDGYYYMAAQVDINTYTVDWVVCSEQANAEEAVRKMMEAEKGGTYTEIFGGAGTEMYVSQEADARNHGVYIGQYPI